MKIRKLPAAFAAAILAGALGGCSQIREETELNVFAAASMTETLTELGDAYMEEHPEVVIRFNFDSSGTLKTQIEEGAACDIFISAAQKQMDELDIAAGDGVNRKRLDFVLEGTRIDLLENQVALVVPEDNPAEIQSFEDWAGKLAEKSVFMAMGNEDVPVGQYTQKILDYYQLQEEELAAAGCITYGTNVKEVTSQLAEGAVDCGIIYATDAFSAGLRPVDTAKEEMCGRAVYPAAVLKISENPEEAEKLLIYLTGEEADRVFERVGFVPVN